MSEAEPTGWNRPAFAVERRVVTVRDVIQSAHFRGELEPFWADTLVLLEGKKQADERGLDPDEAALQSASEQFRYERDLITAEETERWIEERGLTLEDFSDYFRRRFWKDAPGEKTEPDGRDWLSASAELRDLLRVELLLSGEFDRLAVRLAWRVAAGGAGGAGGAGAPEAVKCEQVKFFLRTGFSEAALEKWLVRLGRDESWLDEMVSLEATYRRECEALLTREACERMLNALRIPLTRMELETIDLESRAAAREAYLCIREDGLPMADVAKSGRYPYRRAEIVCEDLAAESQRKILCAAPGEVLEPIERGDGFQLCRLIQKIEPTLSDAPTRVRIEQRILERHFSELAAGRIVWMIPPSSIHDRASR